LHIERCAVKQDDVIKTALRKQEGCSAFLSFIGWSHCRLVATARMRFKEGGDVVLHGYPPRGPVRIVEAIKCEPISAAKSVIIIDRQG
jgi:hypothetical protein